MANKNEKTETTDNFHLAGKILSHPDPGEDVVITGLSGAFPESRNVIDFRENLFSKKDMVTEDNRRWSMKHPEIPRRSGKVLDIEKFDAGFFGVQHLQSHYLDPAIRIFMEKSVEAIMDAGWNPSELEGTNTGVFVAASTFESASLWIPNIVQSNTRMISSIFVPMIASRVGYHLKLNGPAMIVDTACSSSIYALEAGYRAIRSGQCENAIVGGVNLCVHPFFTLQFNRLGTLSADGACKTFDEAANGFVRSEAIVCVFLQKSKNARRIYAHVIHAKTRCDGFKEEGLTHPSHIEHFNLYEGFYQECKVDPNSLTYLEAHGTGTRVGDPQEVKGIESMFLKKRTTPLLIGSVKSNMGHSEIASSMAGIAKVVIAFEHGMIPPNLHFKTPRKGLECLEQGRLKVVTDPTPLPHDGLVAINGFGLGGASGHMLLRGNLKNKCNSGKPQDQLPRLVCLSGRTQNALNHLIGEMKNANLDQEYIRLYHQIFSKTIKGHHYRGYTIMSECGEIARSSDRLDNVNNRRLYLYFDCDASSTWSCVAQQMSAIPIFRKSVETMRKFVEKQGISLRSFSEDNGIHSEFKNTISNATVILAFVDLLNHLGIRADGVFGLGIGEFICAYYLGCLSMEEAVFCMICKASDVQCSKNSEDVLNSLPILNDDPKWTNHERTTPLTIKNKENNLLHILSKMVKYSPHPKNQWISLSDVKSLVIKELNGSKDHVNSLRRSVDRIPKGSTVLALGSIDHLPNSDNYELLTLQKLCNSNDFTEFLKVLGRLYILGFDFEANKLYPEVSYPVSRKTPMISPHIKWNHDQNWMVANHDETRKISSQVGNFKIRLAEPKWSFLSGHSVDGRIVFPATGYLHFVWKLMKRTYGKKSKIVFENCKFIRSVTISANNDVNLNVMIQKKTGLFEVLDNETILVTGKVYASEVSSDGCELASPVTGKNGLVSNGHTVMNTKDVYQELHIRGYGHSNDFQAIDWYDFSTGTSSIKWNGNWIVLMDGLMQTAILETDSRLLHVPTFIKRLSVDPVQHQNMLNSIGDPSKPSLQGFRNKPAGILSCGGLEIRGVEATSVRRKHQRANLVLEKYVFIPNVTSLGIEQSIRVNMQMILENTPVSHLTVIEVQNESTEILSSMVHSILEDIPLVTPYITVLSKNAYQLDHITVKDEDLFKQGKCHLVVGMNFLQDVSALVEALQAIVDDGYILSREPLNFRSENNPSPDKIDILTCHTTENETLILLRRKQVSLKNLLVDVSDTQNFTWLPILQETLKTHSKVVLHAQNHSAISGIIGLLNCLRQEPSGRNVRCVLTFGSAPNLDMSDPFYKTQLEKNLAINIYKDSQWGTYRHLALDEGPVEAHHCFVDVLSEGDLSSLRWIEGRWKPGVPVPTGNALVHVYYSALNFRDTLIAAGRMRVDLRQERSEQQGLLGMEFSGRLENGQRVVGVLESKALATVVFADVYSLIPVPESWSMEDAATVPTAYMTALYVLQLTVEIKPGESILIHAGSGALGQAAINIALFHGLDVYTTVSTQEKKEFLLARFPKLKAENIGNSRDTSFEQLIHERTKGRGVNYVLNSLSEEKQLASVRCLATNGHFLEVGKYDLLNHKQLDMILLQKQVSFHGIHLNLAFHETPSRKAMLFKLLMDNIEKGAVKPLHRTIYDSEDVEKAFRTMASGKHIGKILIKIREEEKLQTVKPSRITRTAIPRYFRKQMHGGCRKWEAEISGELNNEKENRNAGEQECS